MKTKNGHILAGQKQPFNRIIIVSNRLPVGISPGKNFKLLPNNGGLTSSLQSFTRSIKNKNYLWFGSMGMFDIKKQKILRKKLLKEKNCYPLFFSKTLAKNFYQGFCNSSIWPLFHYFTGYFRYQEKYWNSYKQVNKKFCKEILKIAKPDDLILIQDYHLMLLPKLLKEKNPNLKVGFFMHIPFPSLEVFQYLPKACREEILHGLLASDLLGFHTTDYLQNFLRAAQHTLGIIQQLGKIFLNNHTCQTGVFPIGIDFEKFYRKSLTKSVSKEEKKWKSALGPGKILISIDRLDYTKGVLKRLEGFEYFLKTHPEKLKKISLALVTIPSRDDIRDYKKLKKKIEKKVLQINKKYATKNWEPIHYFYTSLNFTQLVAFYKIGSVALVTSLKDGMNLIAKEYLAANKHGILILSEHAGCSKQLKQALIINPSSKQEIAQAIIQALNSNTNYKQQKNLRENVKQNNIYTWGHAFIKALLKTENAQAKTYPIRSVNKEVVASYSKSHKRLIILDYDGTLVPFVKNPQMAKPDVKLLKLLTDLGSTPNTHLVIVSGRNREILDKWFGKLPVDLCAEHGSLIKQQNLPWRMLKPLDKNWKNDIRVIMENYVKNVPGSFIEEKDYCLVWHYRGADQKLVTSFKIELLDYLNQITFDSNLQVFSGNKVIEVKNRGIDKGAAALVWTNQRQYDFILSIGDDLTDEDMFKVLPFYGYSIKVGNSETIAQYRVKSHKEVKDLLSKLSQISFKQTSNIINTKPISIKPAQS